jgi:hypothetical protein
MRELALAVKRCRGGPESEPGGGGAERGGQRKVKERVQRKRRQEPEPGGQIADERAHRSHRPAMRADEAQPPGLHRQRLAAVSPEPHEINADDERDPPCEQVSVHEAAALLSERAEQIAGEEDNAEKDQGFVGERGQASANAGRRDCRVGRPSRTRRLGHDCPLLRHLRRANLLRGALRCHWSGPHGTGRRSAALGRWQWAALKRP